MIHADPNTTGAEPGEANREEWHGAGEELATVVKKLVHEDTVRRIIIKHEGRTALEIPLTVGTLLAPWLAAVGAIEVVRTDSPGEPPVAQGEGGMSDVS